MNADEWFREGTNEYVIRMPLTLRPLPHFVGCHVHTSCCLGDEGVIP